MSAIDERALAIIANTPATLGALLAGAEDAPAGGQVWGPREIIAHLLDAEGIAFVERLERIIAEERPYIRSIDPPARLAAGGYLDRPLGDLLDALTSARAAHVPWLRRLGDDALARTGEHDHAGPISAANIVHQWAYHDLQHLRQLAEAMQAPLVPGMGNTRRFYDV